jgi:hypothetical protein
MIRSMTKVGSIIPILSTCRPDVGTSTLKCMVRVLLHVDAMRLAQEIFARPAVA